MNSVKNRKILINTIILYARQIVLLLISFYTIRLILNALGAVDFGIYMVVSGVVALASFLPGAMSAATQRYFSFAIGKNFDSELEKIFSVNLLIYLGISVFALITLEILGLLFVSEGLNVPQDRLEVVQVLYQFSILTFISSLLASPFISIIIANEEMEVYAYISLYEAIAKLCVAISIPAISSDKLEAYGFLLFLVSASTTLIYLIVCRKCHPEYKFNRSVLDWSTFKEISVFTGWTLFGQLTTVARNQGLTIILNQAISPTTAGARAIAATISNQVMVFSSNFNTSLYPAIIKEYSSKKDDDLFNLLCWGSKLTFFLLWVFALPLCLEMDTILRLWLITPPADSIYFSRLAMIETVIMAISLPLGTAARAPGRMRNYELTLGSIQIFVLLLSWSVLSIGYPPASVFIVAIVANILMFFVRLKIVSRLIGIDELFFIKKACFPIFLVAASSGLFSLLIKSMLPTGLLASGFLVIFSMLISIISMYHFGLDANNKRNVQVLIKTKIARGGGV